MPTRSRRSARTTALLSAAALVVAAGWAVGTPAVPAAAAVASLGTDMWTCVRFGDSNSAIVPVPAGAGRVQIVAWGGSGQTIPGATGGRGAAVTASLPVTPGTTLSFSAGCAGTGDAGKLSQDKLAQGISQLPGSGFSKGGAGGIGALEDSSFSVGGNGGGSSGVRDSNGKVLLVAAGGGAGAGAGQIRSDGGNGGGGGNNGGSGTGTRHVGGGAAGGSNTADGHVGYNATGAKVQGGRLGGGGGGGGGGYARGGDGGSGGPCLSCGGGGGGGGSSYVAPEASNVNIANGGADVGDGFILWTWIGAGLPASASSLYTCANGAATYTVPARTYNLTAWTFGAAGAVSGGTDNGAGRGDAVSANLAVRPGQQLRVTAGCPGSGRSGGAGFGTGGQGGAGNPNFLANAFGGGGGGGGSGITATQQNGTVTVNLVAGGGGGAGAGVTATNNASYPGGAGGFNAKTGSNGQPGTGVGTGAQASGGTAGAQTGRNGATGGTLGGRDSALGGGGGGGGYRGGGGGGAGRTSAAGGGGAGTSYVDADLSSGKITNGAGLSSGLVVLVAEPYAVPAAPTAVTATPGTQRATVSWTAPATDGGSPVQYYTVRTYQVVPPANTACTSVTAVPAGARPVQTNPYPSSPVTITNLQQGGCFLFTVTATNQAGDSPVSTPSQGVTPIRTPLAPVILTAVPGNHAATVTFQPSSSDGTLGNPITSYTVTARLGVNVTTGPGITATGATSPITVSGLDNGTNYTVTVYATNAAGSGPESTGLVVFPQGLPGAPTNVVATNATPVGATSGSVRLTFTPPPDTGGRPILSYTAVSTPGNIRATSSDGGSVMSVPGLTIGTAYTFTVFATTGTGDGPASDPSNEATPTPVGTPSPPLTPGAATLDHAAYVSCVAPFDDGGSPIVSYTVTASPGGLTAESRTCPILIEGLDDGVTYTFTVTATNADGGTSESSTPTGPITPHAPSGTAPANDNWANAITITGESGTIVGNNIAATKEDGEPQIQDYRGGASVWYRWTIPTDGVYQFDTCDAHAALPAILEGFYGNSVTSLSNFSSGPGLDLCPSGTSGALVELNGSAGITLSFKVDGRPSGATPYAPYQQVFSLNWTKIG